MKPIDWDAELRAYRRAARPTQTGYRTQLAPWKSHRTGARDRRRPRDRRARRRQRPRRSCGGARGARAGVQTTLLERHGCFGGNITQVGVEGFAWYRHEATVDSEGIGIEFEERAKAMGAAMPEPQSISHALDAEMFKYVADVLVQEAGVEPMLHRHVRRCRSSGTARSVAWSPRARPDARRSSRGASIDGTGDADVAARAGARDAQDAARGNDVGVGHVLDDRRQQATLPRCGESRSADLQATGRASGEWHIETTGKEDALFSPFLRKPFKQAVEAGVIPASLATIAGTWGAVSDQGDLTYLNLIHLSRRRHRSRPTSRAVKSKAGARPCMRSKPCGASCRAARARSCAISA